MISAEMEGEDLNSLQKLRNKTLARSGLSYERAFAIDEVNLGEAIGEYHMTALIELFFAKVYACTNTDFRSLFVSSAETNVQNLTDYLMQRLGGPSYYSDRKGFPALGQRHSWIKFDLNMVVLWLDFMEQALDEMAEHINPENSAVFLDFLRYSAFYLLVLQEEQREHAALGPYF